MEDEKLTKEEVLRYIDQEIDQRVKEKFLNNNGNANFKLVMNNLRLAKDILSLHGKYFNEVHTIVKHIIINNGNGIAQISFKENLEAIQKTLT